MVILSLKRPSSNGESGGPFNDPSSSSMLDSSLHQNDCPGLGLYGREKNLNFLKNLDVTHNLTFSILLSSVFKRATRAIFVFSLNYSLEVFDTISARFVLKFFFFDFFRNISVFIFRKFPQNFDLLICYLII